ncbi:MAG: polyhydroxyalkanoate synthesis repressor PhaR [Pseudomonadota bacterium]|jgi:polyhydroxyalkanoate synthesis repressor PhaR
MSIANSRKNKKKDETVIIKKYANRRLYNMQDSMYITLADVRQMVTDNISFIVLDAKDNTDLTRSVLLQIIMEAEQEGNPLFSSKVLEQLIRTYSNSMQSITSSYLEHHMQSLQNMQENWVNQAKSIYGKKFSQDTWLEWLNQNQQNFLEVSLNWQNTVLEQIQQQNPLLNFLNAFQQNTNDKK